VATDRRSALTAVEGTLSPTPLFIRPLNRFAGASRWTPQAPERLEVFTVDGPDRPHFDAVEPLADQQAADIGVRCVEFGRDLRDGQRPWPFHAEILARYRNNFGQTCYAASIPRTEARAVKAWGSTSDWSALRQAWERHD
jgi:hypothetical protein